MLLLSVCRRINNRASARRVRQKREEDLQKITNMVWPLSARTSSCLLASCPAKRNPGQVFLNASACCLAAQVQGTLLYFLGRLIAKGCTHQGGSALSICAGA